MNKDSKFAIQVGKNNSQKRSQSAMVPAIQYLPMTDEDGVLALCCRCGGASLRRPLPGNRNSSGSRPASQGLGTGRKGRAVDIPRGGGGLGRWRRRRVELGGLEEGESLRERSRRRRGG
jgi:hypothetical protein